MTTLISQPEMSAKMGEAGKKLVEEKFTLNRMVEELEQYFYSILDKKKEE